MKHDFLQQRHAQDSYTKPHTQINDLKIRLFYLQILKSKSSNPLSCSWIPKV